MITDTELMDIVIEESYLFDVNNGYVEDCDEDSFYFEITEGFTASLHSQNKDLGINLHSNVDLVVEDYSWGEDYPFTAHCFTLSSINCLASKEDFTKEFKKALWIEYNRVCDEEIENKLSIVYMLSKGDKKILSKAKEATIKINFVERKAVVTKHK